MKRLVGILLLLGVALTQSGSVTQYHAVVARKKASAVLILIAEEDGGSANQFGSSTDEWMSGDFDAPSTTTVRVVSLKMEYVNADGADNVTVGIYTNNGSDEPGTLVGSEDTQDPALTASQEWYDFTVNAPISSGTSYVIVAKVADGGLASFRRIKVGMASVFTAGYNVKESGDLGTSWNTTGSGKKISYRLYE